LIKKEYIIIDDIGAKVEIRKKELGLRIVFKYNPNNIIGSNIDVPKKTPLTIKKAGV
jgi:hypothetical protein